MTTSKEEFRTTSFRTLHVGLLSDDEQMQLISEEGEHILTIESYPLQGNAELIMNAVNSYHELLSTLKAVYNDIELNNVKGGSDELNVMVQNAINNH